MFCLISDCGTPEDYQHIDLPERLIWKMFDYLIPKLFRAFKGLNQPSELI